MKRSVGKSIWRKKKNREDNFGIFFRSGFLTPSRIFFDLDQEFFDPSRKFSIVVEALVDYINVSGYTRPWSKILDQGQIFTDR